MDFRKEVDVGIRKITGDLKKKDAISGKLLCPHCKTKLRFTIFNTYFCPRCMRDLD